MRDYPRISLYSVGLTHLLVDVDEIEFTTLPMGELHVELSEKAKELLQDEFHVVIDCRPRTYSDLGYLALLTQCIRESKQSLVRFDLLMPYFPGAGQIDGTPGTVSLVTTQVTSLNFGRIDLWDPHSLDLVEQLRKTTVTGINWPDLPNWPTQKYVAVIAPDKGAVGRATNMAHRLGYQPEVICCEKVYDPDTKELVGVELVTDRLFLSLPEGTYLLFDDICDGGSSFSKVANVVSEAYRQQYGRAADIDLYVTHGIFSEGTERLFEDFTTIYSTTSWCSHEELLQLDVIPVPIHALENRG